MNIFGRIKEAVTEAKSYMDGLEAGEEWVENGGGPVDDTTLHNIQVNSGHEGNWRSFNHGFVANTGYIETEEEE